MTNPDPILNLLYDLSKSSNYGFGLDEKTIASLSDADRAHLMCSGPQISRVDRIVTQEEMQRIVDEEC
jgi:hypothetical protein